MKKLIFSLLFASIGGAGATELAPAWPIKASGRTLVDQSNAPFLMIGDSPQALITNLSEADASSFFAQRHSQGFNTVWINLLCTTATSGVHSDGSTYDGIAPFLVQGDLSQPNPDYFSRVDDMLNLAAQNGITVILDPAETIGWLSVLRQNGTTKVTDYGAYIGNRYKNFPNIIWLYGNDFQTWGTASDDALVLALANGVKSADPNHLHTIELNYLNSCSLDDSNWSNIVGINFVYTYFPTYAESFHAYNKAAIPLILGEASYEQEHNGNTDEGSVSNLRRQEWQTMLAGASGQLYGSYWTDGFADGWQSNLSTPGAVQLGYLTNFFGALQWWSLVPDQEHSFVTSGYGLQYTNLDASSASNTITNDTFLTAAITPDGTLGILYSPTIRSFTVDLTKFSAPVTAQWFDPTNNTYQTATGSPFSNAGSMTFMPPGNNSEGSGDWVLLLTANSASSPTPAPTPTPGSHRVGKDFNGDGNADLVWENASTGQRAIWFLKNGVLSNSIYLPTIPVQWRIVGAGDFDGDGFADLVWENTATGEHAIWFLINGVFSRSAYLPRVSVEWRIAGAGDFDGSGFAGLVWENTSTGEHAIWFLKNGVVSHTASLPTLPVQWHIAGVGDFDGDGQADLAWENTSTGEHAIWFLKNGVVSHTTSLPTLPVQWHISGVADFNGDGFADLVWENTATGERAIWFLENGVISSSMNLPTVPVAWNIVNH